MVIKLVYDVGTQCPNRVYCETSECFRPVETIATIDIPDVEEAQFRDNYQFVKWGSPEFMDAIRTPCREAGFHVFALEENEWDYTETNRGVGWERLSYHEQLAELEKKGSG